MSTNTQRASHRRRQFINANPPRRCRAVPATLEMKAIEAAQALLNASGTRVKPSEAEIKVDFRSEKPTITVGSRFPRKWMKRVSFTLPTDDFNFQPVGAA